MRRPLTVLIVEDDKDTADSLALLLSLTAFEPLIARSGAEALRVARDHRPDVALVDLALPDIDGFSVAERLRQSVVPAPEIAAVTGFGDRPHVNRCQEVGFDRHFLKPFDFNDLANYLREKAERRRQGHASEGTVAGA
jgi:DNA-binding response OmpR family regulator